MTNCIWKFHRDACTLLGSVRTESDLEVCEDEDVVWIRCQQASDELQKSFMRLPVVHFSASEDGQLIERGTRVPLGYVPKGPWIPIAQWMKVTAPIAGLSGCAPQPISIEMAPCDEFKLPQLMRTDFKVWGNYAVNAPLFRLERLAFATSGDGTIYIKGDPLPAIPGERYVLEDRIAVEAGWKWRPEVAPEVVQSALNIRADELVVLDRKGDWLCLSEECFVQASRAAVRATSQEFGYVC